MARQSCDNSTPLRSAAIPHQAVRTALRAELPRRRVIAQRVLKSPAQTRPFSVQLAITGMRQRPLLPATVSLGGGRKVIFTQSFEFEFGRYGELARFPT